MDRKNFISKLFMIGIAAVIPKVFMKPTIYKGAIFRPTDGQNYIRGECGGPELYPHRWVKWKLKPNEIREVLRFEAYKDS